VIVFAADIAWAENLRGHGGSLSLLPKRLLFLSAKPKYISPYFTAANTGLTDAATALRIEQVKSLYSSIPASFIATTLIALILVWIQVDVVPRPNIITWLATLALVLCARTLLFIAYRRSSVQTERATDWLLRFRISTTSFGVVWGLASILLFPANDIPHQAFLAFALAGLSAGAITLLSIDRGSVLLFTVTALSVLIVRLFSMHDATQMAMAAMVSLFLLFLIMIAERSHRTLEENVKLRLSEIAHEKALKENEARLREAQRVAHVGNYDWDPVNGKLWWSNEHYRLWGLAPQSITPDYAAYLRGIHPEDVAGVEDKVQQALKGGRFYEYIHRVVWPDGEIRWILARGEVVFDGDGQAIRMYGTVLDITEQKLADAELRIAAIAFESMEGIVVTDANQIILKVNRAFSSITGYSAEEAIGNTVGGLLRSGRHPPEFYREMWRELNRNKFWQGEIWNRRKDGSVYPEWLSISTLSNNEGQTTHYVAMFSDITEKKQAEETIYNLAFYDALTGLPNRRLLLDRLQNTIASCARHHRHGAVLFIDLDNFKVLNDTLGHDVGDQLLIEIAARLKTCVRIDDTVARQGGDEFVVVLNDLNSDTDQAAIQAEAIAEKIRASLNEPFMLRGNEYHGTPSIGISLFLSYEFSVDELLKRADTAMYEAKRAGRNSIRFFDPATHAAMQTRIALETDLRHALSENQFRLYYQMQVDRDGRILAAEVLLRWLHQSKGLIPPLQFIPMAEETGLILPIGHWILETACRQLQVWQTHPQTRDLQLSVNVSARQFRQSDFVSQVDQILERTGVDPSRLKLELTESLMLDNINQTIIKMQALKGLGVCFSMDDFGTGYSSLAYLSQLPLDEVKIDQSFVRDLDSNPGNAIIVQTIIGMTKNLGLNVIAEGVETSAQHAFLEKAGCYHYQGFLFSKPVPLDEFEILLRNNKPDTGKFTQTKPVQSSKLQGKQISAAPKTSS
jgi:diguanylate cyclase (GGDEF)-like protein/PAS domain S-box-containing protein